MAFEVEMLEEAKTDYYEIIDWYEQEKSGLGLLFYRQMNSLFQKLELHPNNYSYYSKPYRHTIVKGFPYRIVFKVESNKVIINAIFHTSRSPKQLRKLLQ
jgi:hypothetical protein